MSVERFTYQPDDFVLSLYIAISAGFAVERYLM